MIEGIDGLDLPVTDWIERDWLAESRRRRCQIDELLGGRRECSIFGAGEFGRQVRSLLENQGFTVSAFVDNDPTKDGTTLDGLPVLRPQSAARRQHRNTLWVIAVYTNSGPRAQCQDLGVDHVTFPEIAWVFPDALLPYYALDAPEKTLEHLSAIAAAADVWSDPVSSAEFRSQIAWRLTLDYGFLHPPRPRGDEYYPEDLVTRRSDEVFVDCGAYQGDTVDWFNERHGGRFKKIIAVEPDSANAAVMRTRLDSWRKRAEGDIDIHQVAIGARRETVAFDITGTVRSQVGGGRDTIQVVPLDELLADVEPTFMKMDVEGAEQAALEGAQATIQRAAPVLSVCLYHRPTDLWAVPLMIRSLRSDYRLHLRRYSDECWETVCFAIPPERSVP